MNVIFDWNMYFGIRFQLNFNYLTIVKISFNSWVSHSKVGILYG